jgi:hypothetical protein
MRRIFVVMLGLLVVELAACQKPAPPAEPAPSAGNEPAAATTPADTPDTSAPNEGGAADASAGITMRYSCDGGHGVAIVRGDTARVTLADGRVVEIKRVADSSPPRYSGEALSFEVGNDGGTLGQDETGGFACREAD